MKCPDCGSELIKRKKGWFCDDCDDYKQPIDIDTTDELFYTDAFDSYYPLLAHEYYVLYGFMKERNYFGALLEYKDVVEIVLKFPTLAAINHLWRKDNYELKEEKAILELLLGKPLSLGDWKAICELFIKLYGKKGLENYALTATLKPLLEAVGKLYNESKIVHWRNETIGHGALQTNLESDSLFNDEFSDRLRALKNHLQKSRALYDQFEVLDASGCPLRGKDSEGHIGDMLRVRLGDAEYDQEPFILVKDQTTNIFDSFARNSVYVLSYITGKKGLHGLADVFTEKRNKYFSNEDLDRLEQSASKLTDKVFISKDIENISKMADEKEVFTNPEYIVDDIKSFLDKSDNGVLFLQMERGMGKTTLVRALDQLSMGNVSLDDGQDSIAVRAYYINNMFSYRMEHFQNLSSSILANAKNFGIEEFLLSGLAFNLIEAEDKASKLAHFLNDMLGVYMQMTTARRLLYIIDGLDEIRYEEKDKHTIFDCIPNSEMLDEGVYVLLTGRRKNECAKWTQEKYAIVEGKAVSTIRYSRSDEHNTRTLERYLTKQLYPKETAKLDSGKAEKVKTVIEKGDHRFLYVKALRELLKDDSFDINEVKGGDVMERYLKVLERKYGKGKHYDKMKRLLLITALLDEPASIEELCYLFSFESASLMFIGCLTDIKGLLHIDRTGTGETISANIGAMHEDWKQFLFDGNKEMVHSIITSWINEIKERMIRYAEVGPSVIKNITDGESYLIANIYSLVEAYLPEKKSFFSDKSVRYFLFIFAEEITESNTIISAVRAEKIYTGLISYIESQSEPSDEDELADYYRERGEHRFKLQLLGNSIEDYDRCISIREVLRNKGELLDEDDLYIVYMLRGDAYIFMTEYVKAIADLDKCVEILEGIRGEESFDESYLAIVYNDRGLAYYSMTEYDKAIAEYDRGIEIIERLRDKGELFDENGLALVYMNRGLIYYSRTEYNTAITELNKCVEIWERLRDEGELFDENDLAKAYLNRGFAYNSMTEYDKAIADNDRCVEIWERLRDEGKLFEENNLAMAYLNMGRAYLLMTEYDKAITDNDRCVEIWERLRDEGKLYNEHNLAMAYLNRGAAYLTMTEYDKAIADNDRCVEIWERLLDEGKLYDVSGLSLAYMNRGVVYLTMEEYDKAIAENGRCIEIWERLHNEGKLFDENNLAMAYLNRGLAYLTMEEYDKAIAENGRCIEIWERLLDEGKLYDENNLAKAYMNRSEACYSMEEYDKAILDYDKCIEIREGLRDRGKLPDESDLAEIYNARGLAYNSIEEYGKAITNYDRCLEIMKELRDDGKSYDEENLAVSYMNRGVANNSMEEYGKAILDYGKCIEIRERLRDEGNLSDESDLVNVYNARGLVYNSMEKYSKALADFDKCLEIMERNDDDLYDEDDFAKVRENRKAAMDAMKR
jgi:tetratricopeptide (TPR) repeat protein